MEGSVRWVRNGKRPDSVGSKCVGDRKTWEGQCGSSSESKEGFMWPGWREIGRAITAGPCCPH